MAEYSASVFTSHPAEPQMYRCRLLGISHYYCPPRLSCESAWAFGDLFPCRPVSGWATIHSERAGWHIAATATQPPDLLPLSFLAANSATPAAARVASHRRRRPDARRLAVAH